MFGYPEAIVIGISVVMTGGVVLGAIRGKSSNKNPGNSKNLFIPRGEFNSEIKRLDGSILSIEKSLSKEIKQTRETLVREIGTIKDLIA